MNLKVIPGLREIRARGPRIVANCWGDTPEQYEAFTCQPGRVKPGDLLLLEAFGGGFTWGAALVRY